MSLSWQLGWNAGAVVLKGVAVLRIGRSCSSEEVCPRALYLRVRDQRRGRVLTARRHGQLRRICAATSFADQIAVFHYFLIEVYSLLLLELRRLKLAQVLIFE